MPPFKKYFSKAQERWANSATGRRKLGMTDVRGKNRASKGKWLPEKSKKRKG